MAKLLFTKSNKAACAENEVKNTDSERKKRKLTRFGIISALSFSMFFALSCNAFATNEVATGISNGMNQLYSLLRMISIPIATIAIVAAAFQIFTGGEKGMEKAKKIIIYAAIGIGICLLGPLLATTIAGWFQNVSHSVTSFGS